METSNTQPRGSRYPLRIFRPFLWWFILVLVLFCIRTHQRLMDKTRLYFSVSMRNEPTEAAVSFDGKPAYSGQHIPLGSHTLTITHSKAEPFTTNLFVWYGNHDFGNIDLKRSTGTLSIQSDPRARWISIQGPELSIVLPNVAATNLVVPTDDYRIKATFGHAEETDTTIVSANSTASIHFTPRLGAITVESDPPGAMVTDDMWRKLGTTPVTISEVPVGVWKGTVAMDEYEPAAVMLHVRVNETNRVSTNLVNHAYAEAMRDAQRQFASGRFDEAAQAVAEALRHKPDDPEAVSLRQKAIGFSHVARARALAGQGDFQTAIAELNASLQLIPENATAKELLADYTKQVADLAERERRQRETEIAEQKAREKIEHLHEMFAALLSGLENAAQFQEHELITTNDAAFVGERVKNELSSGEPSFKILRFDQPPGMVMIQARQTMGIIGYRDCVIAGEEVRKGDTRILFKVLEYDHSPMANILGGILTAVVRQEHDANQQARFQQQIREGARMVEARIQKAIKTTN